MGIALFAPLAEAFFETLFPTRCAGCDMPGALLCPACREALPVIEAKTACPRCFAPYGWLVCTECWDTDLGIDAAVAVGLLERPLSRCVTIFKDGSEKRLADVLGTLLAEAVVARWGRMEGVSLDTGGGPMHRIADAIVPIPASTRAVRKRGYDHALMLAQSVVDQTGIPLMTLMRHVRAVDQRTLKREERLANMDGAFEIVSASVPSRCPDRVLLVDDVLTTGATIRAASRVVRAAGAREVRAGVLARAW